MVHQAMDEMVSKSRLCDHFDSLVMRLRRSFYPGRLHDKHKPWEIQYLPPAGDWEKMGMGVCCSAGGSEGVWKGSVAQSCATFTRHCDL